MKVIKISLAILVTLLALLVIAVWWLLQPVSKSQTTPQTFVVKRGESVSSIGTRLTEAGLIRNPLLFKLSVRQSQAGWDDSGVSIQAGSFKLSPSMNMDQIIEQLTQGTEDVWLTLLEGWRVEEIAAYAADKLTDFDQQVFIDLAKKDEGKLFPDSYLVPKEYSEEQLHQLLLNTFETKVLDGLEKEISQSQLNLNQIITLASLVEREARVESQMRHVAGILLHRLEIGMALQVDASLQYVRTQPVNGNWWIPPLASDKQIPSPYNTYLNSGLPPGPICSPGLVAIKSVLRPLKTDDLFYIHAPDGRMYYSSDLAGHNANVSKYLR